MGQGESGYVHNANRKHARRLLVVYAFCGACALWAKICSTIRPSRCASTASAKHSKPHCSKPSPKMIRPMEKIMSTLINATGVESLNHRSRFLVLNHIPYDSKPAPAQNARVARILTSGRFGRIQALEDYERRIVPHASKSPVRRQPMQHLIATRPLPHGKQSESLPAEYLTCRGTGQRQHWKAEIIRKFV